MPAPESKIAFVPSRLLEPAKVPLTNIHRGAAASANNLLRPIGPDGNDLHAFAPEVTGEPVGIEPSPSKGAFLLSG